MTARQVHKVRGMLRNPTTTYGVICHVAGITNKAAVCDSVRDAPHDRIEGRSVLAA